ncbi:MAG TPA: 4-hydroxyphenylacetate 3-hydroxylase N-terminal domain-containing protein, partial [Chloroflexota bacterium]|nr:4-hydroxyphenylacetate 3-hydroxylase N-terminal domain-containing protein [Chloroflexota bacterium]
SAQDLTRKRLMFELLERRCGGVLGRHPQYVAIAVLGLYSVRHLCAKANPEFATNIERYLDRCRECDLSITFGFTDPPRDRALDSSAMEYLKIVDRRPDGIVVRGAKAVATAAPYSDEYLGLTAPRPDLKPDEVLYFAIPVATKGLKFICRESFAHASRADHALSAVYDEMDAWAVFEDVFIPNDRIFFRDRVDMNAEIFRQIPSAWGYYFGNIRVVVKTEALAGIGFAVTDYLGTRGAPNVESMLADVVAHLETLRSLVEAAEQQPVFTAEGLAMPNPLQVMLGRILTLEQHQRILDITRELCGSSILMAPGEAELGNPDIGPALRRYIGGKDERALDRFKLMKLAWDYTSDSFAARQLLFEMYNASTLASNKGRLLGTYDPSKLVELAKELAGI